MTTRLKPVQCLYCARRQMPAEQDPVQKCTAFPNGIPDAIWQNQADHRQPFPGDGGLRFEALPHRSFPEEALRPVPTGGGGTS